MSIKHAMLGLLSEQPMHGYRLKEAFDERVGGLWGLTTGQIYQTLKALERAALLEGRGERVGARPARRIYSLTPQGTRALNAWLDETPAPWTRWTSQESVVRASNCVITMPAMPNLGLRRERTSWCVYRR